EVEAMRQAYDSRRKLTCELLESIPGVRLARPKGAFYAFPDLSEFIGRKAGDQVIEDDIALAGYFIEEASVALVPGSAFGAPGFARITYACDEATIERGVNQMKAALLKLT
ncbi:MAG: aminotransferase class I/II-fold pyridoxal phosphate-dependent enzyme, partial [Myxococcales bacterium]|nr:aminotransferase class I/II-fold pyridoxal phosphate-dependent enzyme [Myxococcales bacterium]